jgi:L-serine dehydratase
MKYSAFDVIGPAMIGPSSSHTAGAVRIGRVARALLSSEPVLARVELHGSFAATGAGHATDRALAAGLLGFNPDDERLKDSLRLAAERKLDLRFTETDLGTEVHPNSARLTLKDATGETRVLTGSSIGGGKIEIVGLDGYETSFSGEHETLILWNRDQPGYLARVTAVLACIEVNIATIRTSRSARGARALTVLEVDGVLPPEVLGLLGRMAMTERLRHLERLP